MNKKMLLLTCLILLTLLERSAFAQETAPDFTLTDIDGIEFSLSDYIGKCVILDFFGTICTPCVEEIPILKLIHQEFNDTLIIITISISPEIDTVDRLQQFRQDNNITWILARDTNEVSVSYGIHTIPTLIIIDQMGYIRYQHIGLTDQSVLQTELDEVIPEFGTWISMMLILLMFTVALIMYKRKSIF